jgi:hypothetical protein
MLGIDKPNQNEKRREREWFKGKAGDAAIKTLWSAADKLGGVEGQYLKVLLLTGKRKTALAKMPWSQIDQNWFWDVPEPARKTNKRLHSVPLSSLVQRIIHPRQARGYVFARPDGKPIDVEKKLTRRIKDAGVMDDFFLHGCRHLAETKMAELQVPPHIRDRLCDHVEDRGSGSKYDHHAYEKEMREALEKWSDHVEQLVQPSGAALLR